MASISVRATTAIEAARARCPRMVAANVQTRRPTAEKKEMPLVMRCVNSIIVFAVAEYWKTVPLQRGQ